MTDVDFPSMVLCLMGITSPTGSLSHRDEFRYATKACPGTECRAEVTFS